MNHLIVDTFREKLEKLSISDYHGLQGPGLTCYLNSVLQVLFMTEEFRAAVKRCCSHDSSTIDKHLGRLFTMLERGMTRTHKITKLLGITDVYEQRDAAEYFEKILCLSSPEAFRMFRGELNQKTRCHKCHKENQSKSFFSVLPLTMEDSCRQTYDVEQGLKTFFMVEEFSCDNQMYCSCCDKKQHADIEWEMSEAPDVLTLLLKRFTYDHKMKCYIKLECRAVVPQTLLMKMCTYDLYAVVDHCGTLTGGHYTALIQSFENGEWYCFDDGFVKKIDQLFGAEKSFRSKTAYLLMYRKVKQKRERTDGSSQDAPCAHSENRDSPPLHQQQSEGLKHMNGDILTKSHDHDVWRKQIYESNQRAVWRVPAAAAHRDGLETRKLHLHSEPNRQQTDRNMRGDQSHDVSIKNRIKESKTARKTVHPVEDRSLKIRIQEAAAVQRSESPSAPRRSDRMNGSSFKTNREPQQPIKTVTARHRSTAMTKSPWRG